MHPDQGPVVGSPLSQILEIITSFLQLLITYLRHTYMYVYAVVYWGGGGGVAGGGGGEAQGAPYFFTPSTGFKNFEN